MMQFCNKSEGEFYFEEEESSFSSAQQLQMQEYQSSQEFSNTTGSNNTFETFIKDPSHSQAARPLELRELQESQIFQLDQNPVQTGQKETVTPNSSDQYQKKGFQNKQKGIKKQPKEKKKQKKQRREPYPTKNFLQAFKPYFLHYLRGRLGISAFETHPLASRISQKKGINLRDFEELFNEEAFQSIWADFFEEGVHFRLLMRGVLTLQTKKMYFSRIHVFREAFNQKVFKKIN